MEIKFVNFIKVKMAKKFLTNFIELVEADKTLIISVSNTSLMEDVATGKSTHTLNIPFVH